MNLWTRRRDVTPPTVVDEPLSRIIADADYQAARRHLRLALAASREARHAPGLSSTADDRIAEITDAILDASLALERSLR